MAPLTYAYAPFFSGTAFMLILYGFATILTAQYFHSYPKDPRSTKLTIAFLAACGFCHMTLICAWEYQTLISHFGNLLALNSPTKLAPLQAGFLWIMSFTCQSYFASRIWVFSKKNHWLVVPVVILSLAQLIAGIYSCVKQGQLQSLVDIVSLKNIYIFLYATHLATDFLITAEISVLLYRSRSGIKASDWLVSKLISFSFHRGIFSTILAAGALGLVLGDLKTEQFAPAIALPAAPFYFLNVLSVLHSRNFLRNQYSMKLSGMSSGSGSNGVHTDNSESFKLGPINISRVSHQHNKSSSLARVIQQRLGEDAADADVEAAAEHWAAKTRAVVREQEDSYV